MPPGASDVPIHPSHDDTCIVVLGMHRSGTSAMTGLLEAFGACAGDDLLPANASNPKGFFENRKLVDLNNQLMAACGVHWDALESMPPGWHERQSVRLLHDAMASFLLSPEFHGKLRLLKDPRLCRTLPAWLEVLSALGIRPVFVVCARDPLAVVQSIRKMKGFPYLKALLLYLDYCIMAERHSRGHPRCFVSYADLVTDWQAVMEKIDAALALGWQRDRPSWEARAGHFVSSELNRSDTEDHSAVLACGRLTELAQQLHAALEAGDPDAMDGCAEACRRYVDDVRPWFGSLQEAIHVEDRFPFLEMPERCSATRLLTTISWTGRDEEPPADAMARINWTYPPGGAAVLRLRFNAAAKVRRIRLHIMNRPGFVRLTGLAIFRGSAVLARWAALADAVTDSAKTVTSLPVSNNEALAAWLFVDSHGYVDIAVPGADALAVDMDDCLELQFGVEDIRQAIKPLVAKLTRLRKEVQQARTAGAELNADKIGRYEAQQAAMAAELLRAEAQLELLKDVLMDGRPELL